MVEVIKFSATGRRKSSVARVTIQPGTGAIRVNKREFKDYFPRETDRILILEPMKITNTVGKFDITAKVMGGGLTGQTGAIQLALSRALTSSDIGNRALLKKTNLLTRDPRMKERQKPGQKGARKKFQWVKR